MTNEIICKGERQNGKAAKLAQDMVVSPDYDLSKIKPGDKFIMSDYTLQRLTRPDITSIAQEMRRIREEKGVTFIRSKRDSNGEYVIEVRAAGNDVE